MAVKLCLLILPDPLGNNVALLLHNGWAQLIIVLGVEGRGGGGGGDKNDRDHLSAQD